MPPMRSAASLTLVLTLLAGAGIAGLCGGTGGIRRPVRGRRARGQHEQHRRDLDERVEHVERYELGRRREHRREQQLRRRWGRRRLDDLEQLFGQQHVVEQRRVRVEQQHLVGQRVRVEQQLQRLLHARRPVLLPGQRLLQRRLPPGRDQVRLPGCRSALLAGQRLLRRDDLPEPQVHVYPLAARRDRLSRLRQRLVAVTLRSRSVRLAKPTRSGALDLHRLIEANGAGFERLVAALGREGGEPVALSDLVPRSKSRAFADDLAALAHAARGAWLETGMNDLAIGWPFLSGRMPDGAWLRGPVLLYPVSLEVAKTGRARWVVTSLGPPELNESLAHVLSRGLGAQVPAAGPGGDDPRPPARLRRGLARSDLRVPRGGRIPVTRGTSAEVEPLAPLTEEDCAAWPEGALSLRSQLVLGRFPRLDSAILADYDQLLSDDPSDEALGVAARLLSVDEGADSSTRRRVSARTSPPTRPPRRSSRCAGRCSRRTTARTGPSPTRRGSRAGRAGSSSRGRRARASRS